jgi:hypothetical protein
MESSVISALSGLIGAAFGGIMSFFGTWLVHGRDVRAQWVAEERLRRQDLYKEFIEEAAKCYVEALQTDKPNVATFVVLYAKMSRMRGISSPKVLAAADHVLKRIADAYSEPQLIMTNDRLRAMLGDKSMDALRDFGEACREEAASVRARQF